MAPYPSASTSPASSGVSRRAARQTPIAAEIDGHVRANPPGRRGRHSASAVGRRAGRAPRVGGARAPAHRRPRRAAADAPARPRAGRPTAAARPSRPAPRPSWSAAGIAGVSAAVVLAERGVAVTLLEAAPTLGGRLGAWPHTLPDGTEQVVEHGFHAFFRHYHTWRALLRRIDPRAGVPAPGRRLPGDLAARGRAEDLTGLPAAPPLNLLALFARSPSLGLRDLLGSDQALAAELLAYDRGRTTARVRRRAGRASSWPRWACPTGPRRCCSRRSPARSSPTRARCRPAELIAMFHYYFLGNPEGIGFDAPDTDYLTCIWAAVRGLPGQARRRRCAPARRRAALAPADGHRWRVELDDGGARTPRTSCWPPSRGALRDLLAASPRRRGGRPAAGREGRGGSPVAPPFAVTRLWLDRDVAPRARRRSARSAASRRSTRSPSTPGWSGPSAQWAARTGGSVVELHSYACTAPDVDTATARMRAELAALWPETADAAGRAPAAADGGHRADVPAGRRRQPARCHRARPAASGWPATTSRRRS